MEVKAFSKLGLFFSILEVSDKYTIYNKMMDILRPGYLTVSLEIKNPSIPDRSSVNSSEDGGA